MGSTNLVVSPIEDGYEKISFWLVFEKIKSDSPEILGKRAPSVKFVCDKTAATDELPQSLART